MLVHIVEAEHNNEVHRLAVMPYLKDHIVQLLDSFEIPCRTTKAIVYHDYFTAQSFVVHPDTHEQLWLADKLALQLQGFCRLVKEVPKFEPTTVVEASKFED
jgi:hypothetical protein